MQLEMDLFIMNWKEVSKYKSILYFFFCDYLYKNDVNRKNIILHKN